jgi:hypothetical protein
METSRRVSITRACTRALRIFSFSSVLLACAQGASGGWLEDQIVWIQNRLNQTYSRANTAASQASSAATQALASAQNTDGLKEVLVRIQDSYDRLDGSGIDLMESLLQMMADYLAEQQNGYEAFTTADGNGTSPADAFRQELTVMLEESAQFMNELAALDGGLHLELEFGAIDTVLGLIPDRLLFPMQKALNSNVGLSKLGLVDRIRELREDLPLFETAYAGAGAGDVAFASIGTGENRPVHTWSVSQRTMALQTGRGWKATGTTIGLIGKVLSAIAEFDEFQGKIGIHGYVAIHAKFNKVAVVAALVDALAEGISKNGERLEGIFNDAEALNRHNEVLALIVDADGNRIDGLESSHSTLLANQQLILANQALILDGQKELFEAMKRLDPGLFPDITQTPPAATMAMDVPPSRLHVDFGEPVTLTAGALESPNATYQWRLDGTPIDGAVYSSLNIREVTSADTGEYDVVITDESGSRVSATASLALIPGRVLNVSVRQVIPDNGVLITGFVLDSEKRVVVRGVGRSLAAFGIPEAETMQDPVIRIHNAAGDVVAENDNYERSVDSDAAMQAVGAFPITASSDAAIVTTLPEGHYTVLVKGADFKGGDCIVEVYDTEGS